MLNPLDLSEQEQVAARERIAEQRGFLVGRMEFFRVFLKKQIDASGLSQKDIGDKIGADNTAVSHWVNGRRMPSTSALCNICDMLKLSDRRRQILIGSYFAAKYAEGLIEIIDTELNKNRNLVDIRKSVDSLIVKIFEVNIE